MAKYLSDFASCRVQCGHKGSLKEIYLPIAQKKKSPYLIPEIKIKFRLETLTHDFSIIWYEMHFKCPYACGCI